MIRGVVYILGGIYSRLAKVVIMPFYQHFTVMGPADAEHNASYVGSVLGAESPPLPAHTGRGRADFEICACGRAGEYTASKCREPGFDSRVKDFTSVAGGRLRNATLQSLSNGLQ